MTHTTRIGFVVGSAPTGPTIEWLNSEPVGDGIYRLLNSPFYAFGVSWLDIVRAEESDGRLYFAGVVSPSGHSTYRLWLPHLGAGEFERSERWEALHAMGCSFEAANERLIAIALRTVSSTAILSSAIVVSLRVVGS